MDANELRAWLEYDPETGGFTNDGQEVGYTNSQGYRKIGRRERGKLKTYGAARLAFLWMEGRWPDAEMDHINGIRGDDRWVNLREASRTENNRNTRGWNRNKVGFKGVTAHVPGPTNRRRIVRYQATIRKGGKQVYLGSFSTPEDAHAAYNAVAQETFGAFANSGDIS